MKFETLMLRSLFAACLAVCGLILGAMLVTDPSDASLADTGIAAILLAAPGHCALVADGVICPHVDG